MPLPFAIALDLTSSAESDRLGQVMAPHLGPGDTVLLRGTLGAGKSHLARVIIQNRLGRLEDVPSPTFTLVQIYDTPECEIWHADLYRLSHPDEVMELGLEDAFATAICLVEWPDRLGRLVPANAIEVTLSHEGEGRRAELAFSGRPGLQSALRGFAE